MDQFEDNFGKLGRVAHTFHLCHLGEAVDYGLGGFLTSGPSEVGGRQVVVCQGWPHNFWWRTFAST